MTGPDQPAVHPEAMARARTHLCIALDVEDLESAVGLARAVRPYVAVAKVGLELFAAAGPTAVRALLAEEMAVFLDLKLHDIPTTVGRAAAVLGRYGVSYLTVHTNGGVAMCAAAVEGLADGAAAAGLRAPVALGVTVLTSDADADPGELARRSAVAVASGCRGLVCAAPDLAVTKSVAPGLLAVVPGTRPTGSAHDDQARVVTPGEAVSLGADLLVIGRPITRASHPAGAAAAIAAEIAGLLV
jgi:orotidine-5'-phosphate decarboxylase